MALRNVLKDDHPSLRKKCRPYTEFNDRLHALLDDMAETMLEENGVGLAAPQVGILKRIVVMDVGDGPIVMINPEILEVSGEQTGDEGCLSVPGKSGVVTRPDYVKAKALDADFNEYIIEGEELLARCICHETDHLDGILYVDKVDGNLREATFEGEE